MEGSSSVSGASFLMLSTSFFTSLSSPFMVPHPAHLHFPTSSIRLIPGGACPFTKRQFLHIKASRFPGSDSSSPSNTSINLSYQRDPSLTCAYCGGAGNALGAKSAPGDWGDSGLWDCGDGICRGSGFCGLPCRDGGCGRPWILAVGGGMMPVLWPACPC